jgi:hypothetical protein
MEEKNVDQIRDEKCIPLAKAISKHIAELMIPEDANEKVDYNPIITKILEKTLEADTNLLTENSYIFQLILGIFAGLNKTAQACTTIKIDDVRYGRIEKQILQIVADNIDKITVGSVTPEQTDIDFAPIKEKLNELFASENLSMMELKYVMDNIFDSFGTVTNSFNQSIEIQTKKAEAKLFGLDDITDLSMKKLDEELKK